MTTPSLPQGPSTITDALVRDIQTETFLNERTIARFLCGLSIRPQGRARVLAALAKRGLVWVGPRLEKSEGGAT